MHQKGLVEMYHRNGAKLLSSFEHTFNAQTILAMFNDLPKFYLLVFSFKYRVEDKTCSLIHPIYFQSNVNIFFTGPDIQLALFGDEFS